MGDLSIMYYRALPLFSCFVVVPIPACNRQQDPTPMQDEDVTTTTGASTDDTAPSDDTAAACTNNVVEPGEDCDSLGYLELGCHELGAYNFGPGGRLKCSPTCQFNTAECSLCGNLAIDTDTDSTEECDGQLLNAQTCESREFAPGGILKCYIYSDPLGRGCTFDTSECNSCGNGVIDPDEQEECDPAGPTGPIFANCEGEGEECNPCFPLCGEATCTAECTVDQCHPCGCPNDILEPEFNEECDCGGVGCVVTDTTCEDLDEDYQGTLLCNENCQFDKTECCLKLGEQCLYDDECCSQNCSPLTYRCVVPTPEPPK